MTDLRAAILARCDELERLARDQPHGPWSVLDSSSRERQRVTNGAALVIAECYDSGPAPTIADHIAAWDRDSVLALVSGAREMVAWHGLDSDELEHCQTCEDSPGKPADYPCSTLVLLARMIGAKGDG